MRMSRKVWINTKIGGGPGILRSGCLFKVCTPLTSSTSSSASHSALVLVPPPHTHCPPLLCLQFTAISTLPESPNCACIILAPFVVVQNLLKSVYVHMYQISNVFAKQNELVLSHISCHCHQSCVHAQGLHQILNVFAKPNELVLSRIAHHCHQSRVCAQGSWM